MKEGGLRTQTSERKRSLLSIITVVFNGASSIADTIESVVRFRQDNPLEHIIIDGGSTDETVQVLERFNNFIDYWVSEPDRGIYDAINKGIGLARGEYFYILNIGDKLIEFPLSEIEQAISREADVILFNVLHPNQKIFKSDIDYRSAFGNTIHHQGAFYKRTMNIEYDLSYPVYADFDMNLKLLKQKKKFVRFDKTISYHSLDGISSDRKHLGEYLKVIRRNSGPVHAIVGYLYVLQGELRARLKALMKTLRESSTAKYP